MCAHSTVDHSTLYNILCVANPPFKCDCRVERIVRSTDAPTGQQIYTIFANDSSVRLQCSTLVVATDSTSARFLIDSIEGDENLLSGTARELPATAVAAQLWRG